MTFTCTVCGKQFDTVEELDEHIELDHRLKSLITMTAIEDLVEKLELPKLSHTMTRDMKDELTKAVVDGKLSRYLKRARDDTT